MGIDEMEMVEKVATNKTNIAHLIRMRDEDSKRIKHIEIIVKVEFVTILLSIILLMINLF
jgi:hypothetical protein